jgi:hypothetical protein
MVISVSRKKIPSTRKTMSKTSVRYLVDESGKRVAVVLDLAEYRQLVKGKRTSPLSPKADWIQSARKIRALAKPSADSTPILRDLREGRLR